MSNDVTTLADRVRKLAGTVDPEHTIFLEDVALELEMLESLNASYTEHIATTAACIEALRDQVTSL